MGSLFYHYGKICASRPWEVIITAITIIIVLISHDILNQEVICDWNYQCSTIKDLRSWDVIILTVIRCLAVVFVYLQFRNLKKLGSIYLIGIAGVYTLFTSLIYSIVIVNLTVKGLQGLSEALPFFLLLLDVSKTSTLSRFALSSNNLDDVYENIGHGMAFMGPSITIDALVSILMIGIGNLSGLAQLESLSIFGCIAILANYFTFMTIYPASLSLALELGKDNSSHAPVWYKPKLRDDYLKEDRNHPNPIIMKVKAIMCIGLIFVYGHSGIIGGFGPKAVSLLKSTKYITPAIPLWKFYMLRAIPPSIDYTITLSLAAFLVIKYLSFDSDCENGDNKCSLMRQTSTARPSRHCELRDNSTSMEKEENKSNKQIDVETQTNITRRNRSQVHSSESNMTYLSIENAMKAKDSPDAFNALSDDDIINLVKSKQISAHKLETLLEDYTRGVHVRRKLISQCIEKTDSIDGLPYKHFDYKNVYGACCENVIGYTPIPVGIAGPLLMDGKNYHIPMATTEGCLVASTNRGCRALAASGGVQTVLLNDGMSRAPVVKFKSAIRTGEAKLWLDDQSNFQIIANEFNSTSRFARLKKVQCFQAGCNLFIRLVASTGDAMGMNMLSKGAEKVLSFVQDSYFPDMMIVSLSGNLCTDKKPSAINWIEGRGKSIVCEAFIKKEVVENVLKTNVADLTELNKTKNLIGSSMAGSIGGSNAHAANIVTAIFIATGQDPAQNVVSSNCITLMEPSPDHNEDLYISVSMPSIEVGTVGGGTVLPAQSAALEILGVKGSDDVSPGTNAMTLARIVGSCVLAGELSLMSALAAGHLVKSHMKHNRSSANLCGNMNITEHSPIM